MKINNRVSSILFVVLIGLVLSACGPTVSEETVNVDMKLVGDMLFEGANSLQYSGDNQLAEIAKDLGVGAESVRGVNISAVSIELNEYSRPITESLLLQVVSDNQELKTIGTLSPLPEGSVFKLALAEDTSILDYLKDSGMTWVLDLNLNEDHMDEMEVAGKLSLNVEYNANQN